jgi:hypothetical protein
VPEQRRHVFWDSDAGGRRRRVWADDDGGHVCLEVGNAGDRIHVVDRLKLHDAEGLGLALLKAARTANPLRRGGYRGAES